MFRRDLFSAPPLPRIPAQERGPIRIGELMPAALALAADMLLAQPGMLERYKAIIDDGFALPFGEGMTLERQRAREFNATVTPSDIEQRRAAVRERNRKI